MAEYLPYGFALSRIACKPAPYVEPACVTWTPHPVDVCNGATRTPEYRNSGNWDQYPRCKRFFELRPGRPGSKRA